LLNGDGTELADAKKAIRKLPFEVVRLFTKIQFFDDGAIAIDVCAFQIIEQRTALSYHGDQGTLGTEIFLVGFQMLCQVVDTVRKEGNLSFGGTGIGSALAILFEKGLFNLRSQIHNVYFINDTMAAPQDSGSITTDRH
jgi:hypothetical protein